MAGASAGPSQAKKSHATRKVIGGGLGALLTLGIVAGGVVALGRTEAGSESQSALSAGSTASGDGPSPAANGPTPEAAPEGDADRTAGQTEALRMADSYFENHGAAFSRSTLIGWLEQQGVSREDAVYAADRIDPDWNYHAAVVGYHWVTSEDLSRDQLIQRLMGDGFTNAQAVYGADSAIEWAAEDEANADVSDEVAEEDPADTDVSDEVADQDPADTDVSDEVADQDPADGGVQPTPAPQSEAPEASAGP